MLVLLVLCRTKLLGLSQLSPIGLLLRSESHLELLSKGRVLPQKQAPSVDTHSQISLCSTLLSLLDRDGSLCLLVKPPHQYWSECGRTSPNVVELLSQEHPIDKYFHG